MCAIGHMPSLMAVAPAWHAELVERVHDCGVVPTEHPPQLGKAHPWELSRHRHNRFVPCGNDVSKAGFAHDVGEWHLMPFTDAFNHLPNLSLRAVCLVLSDFVEAAQGEFVTGDTDLVFTHAKSPLAKRL